MTAEQHAAPARVDVPTIEVVIVGGSDQAIQAARSVVRSALKAAGLQCGPGTKAFVLAVAHLIAREVHQAARADAAAAGRLGVAE